MTKILDEGNLRFDFSGCHLVSDVIKFDTKNPNGTTGVDFIAETDDCFYFIEVKDFQDPHPHAVAKRKAGFEMLVAAAKEKKELQDDELSSAKGSIFNLKLGLKIKDSLLRKYAYGEAFSKEVKYIVFINLDKLDKVQRGRLKEKIFGHIPTGFNTDEFSAFRRISFDLVNAEQIKAYGITCTAKS